MGDFPSRLDLFSIGRDFVTTRATKIDPAQVDIQGSDVNIFVGSGSVVLYEIVKQLAYRVDALLLDGAEGEDLDRYAFDRYQLTRKGAAAAVTQEYFSRPTAAAGAGTLAAGTVITTLSGIQYQLLQPASFGLTDLVAAPVNVQAVQAGKDTQVGKNTLVRFGQGVAPFDASIVLTNPLASAHGADREDDDTFRARIRDFWNTARRGILAAIEFGAKTVPGITSAQAVEVVTEGNRPARVVLLYVADETGSSSVAIVDTVDAVLLDYRAAGIAVIVSTSVPLIVDVQMHLVFAAGVDTLTLTQQIRGAVVDFVDSIGVNAKLTLADLYALLRRYQSDGLLVDQDTIVAPAGDLVPDPGTTLRTTLANVTTV